MDFSPSNKSQWSEPSFWTKICPSLSISDQPVDDSPMISGKTAAMSEDRRQQLVSKGFALVNESIAEASVVALRQGIETLHSLNLPASFILLFDITWKVAAISRSLLQKSTLATNQFQFDILAWYIESSGFSPHRDRQPDDTASTFVKGQAKFVTHWIALTEATPENSCLYVIPKDCDPGYQEGDVDDQDPLQRALTTKESYQHIRAIPRNLGQSILFTHRIIHWGSVRDPATKQPPRIAISFICADPSFEKPYVDPCYFSAYRAPPFRIRLLLVCAQLLIYYQRFELSRENIKACYEYCKKHENDLEESYRQKVFFEFVKAMKEVSVNDSTETGVTANGKTNGDSKPAAKCTGQPDGSDNDDDDDEEDAMMEEMLNAEQRGYGEFADDYDELNEGQDIYNEEGDVQAEESADSDDEDEELGATLFGKRSIPDNDEPTTKKRAKATIAD